tara:strand:- start:46 stop:270 length:225 start_codon:yes stop_codon:yes gene_type:complete
MPRHHTVWDAESQRQIEVPFTAEEETARDAEEVQAEIDMAARDEQDGKLIALEAKLAEDSITYEELKELMRLRG